jgi:hypothetical protein
LCVLSPRTISHTIEIDAPPETVWRELADTESYAAWNPFIRSIEGEFEEGTRLRVQIAPPGGRPMTFRPTVRAARPGRELRWLGHLLVAGLFDGEHSFEIEPLGAGRASRRPSASPASWCAHSAAGSRRPSAASKR